MAMEVALHVTSYQSQCRESFHYFNPGLGLHMGGKRPLLFHDRYPCKAIRILYKLGTSLLILGLQDFVKEDFLQI